MATPEMIQELRDYFPEFSDIVIYPDTTVSNMIDEALYFIASCVWGVRYSLGWLYLAAHFLYIRTQTENGAVTPITGALTDLTVMYMFNASCNKESTEMEDNTTVKKGRAS
jgi:exosortase/archaeosortase